MEVVIVVIYCAELCEGLCEELCVGTKGKQNTKKYFTLQGSLG